MRARANGSAEISRSSMVAASGWVSVRWPPPQARAEPCRPNSRTVLHRRFVLVDWLTVVPVAAVVSAVVTLSIRWLDRPRAVLRLRGRADGSGWGCWGPVAVRGSLMKFGDGDVCDLRVFGSGCHAAVPACESSGETLWTYRLTRLKAGESVPIQVTLKPYTGADDDQRAVIVTYSLRPWR